MVRKLVLGLVLGVITFAEVPTTVISTEDANEVLKLQREQYKTFANVQSLQAQLKEKNDELVKLNEEASKLYEKLRNKYNCKDCQLSDDMKWVKPAAVAKK